MPLSAEAMKMKKKILTEYKITDQAGLEILARALESFDRMQAASKIINRDGLTVKNRFDELREHPALNTERKARAQFLLAMKQLNFDIGAPVK